MSNRNISQRELDEIISNASSEPRLERDMRITNRDRRSSTNSSSTSADNKGLTIVGILFIVVLTSMLIAVFKLKK